MEYLSQINSASTKVISFINERISAPMHGNENVAIGVIVAANTIFAYSMDFLINQLNKGIDHCLPNLSNRVKAAKDLVLNNCLFGASLIALNSYVIPEITGFSLGKWSVIIAVICTVGRYIIKNQNKKMRDLEINHNTNLQNQNNLIRDQLLIITQLQVQVYNNNNNNNINNIQNVAVENNNNNDQENN